MEPSVLKVNVAKINEDLLDKFGISIFLFCQLFPDPKKFQKLCPKYGSKVEIKMGGVNHINNVLPNFFVF